MSNIFKRERSKDRAQTLKSRRLRMERLESRELLSVTAIELAEIPELYSSTAFSESASGVDAIDLSAFQSEANASGADLDDADSGRTYVVTTALDVVDPDDGVTSLREAAGWATSLDTIAFAPSLKGETIRLSGSEITISTGITIDASALYDEATGTPRLYDEVTGTPGITISAFGRSRVFSVDGGTADDPVTLIGLTITGGYVSNDDGGAIYVAGKGTLSVKNSMFTRNAAGRNGGAIYVHEKGALSVNDSTFAENTAGYGYDGGAIYVCNGTLNVENSMFIMNCAGDDGGAIGADNGTLSVKNSTFTSNGAEEGGAGGAIGVDNGTLSVKNSTFTWNHVGYSYSSGGCGGAISCGYNNVPEMLNVENSTFMGNSAVSGGAIYSTGTAILSGVTATRNSSRFGGAIYNSGGKMTASNFLIEENESTHTLNSYYGDEYYSWGGGIYNQGTLTLTNGAIVRNVAEAICLGSAGCSTYAYGGGIYNEGKLTATNVTIAGNGACFTNDLDSKEVGAYGGGLYNVYAYCESSATLRNVIIAENYAHTLGDAVDSDVYLESGTLDASRTLSSYEFENANENYLYDPNAPLFVGVVVQDRDVFWDYRLAPFSQAINKGDDQYAYDAGLTENSRDLAGRPRFVGDSVDLGAYERTPIKFPTNATFGDYDASTKTATLTWTDNATNEVRYEIQSLTNDGAWRSLPALPANATGRVCYKLIPGNVYVYRVRAVAADGTASAWASATISPPATPTNATFGDYDASTNTATLTWTDVATNEVRYEIQSATNGGEWTALAELPANATSLVCSGLSRGTVSVYRVRAVSAEGVASAWALAKIEPSTTPTNVKLSDYDASTKTATLTWTDNAPDEVRYEVQSSTNGGAWRSLSALPANTTGRVCYKLIPGNVYVYRVRAVAADGTASAWASATISLPATPTNVTFSDYDASTNTATLTWTDVATNEVRYEIQSSTNGGEWTALPDLPANATSLVCSGLSRGTVSVYRVRAVSAEGVASAWASAKIEPSTIPTNVKLSDYNLSTKTATLTWTDNAPDEVRYEVQSSTNGGAWRSLPDLPANTTGRVCYNLKPGNVYVYRIRAVAADGTATAWASATIAPSTTPTNVKIVDYDASTKRATLIWTKNSVSNRVWYEIQSSTNGGEWRTLAYPSEVMTSRICYNLKPGNVYVYRIRAVENGGTTSAWVSATLDLAISESSEAGSDGEASVSSATLASEAFANPFDDFDFFEEEWNFGF